MSSVLCTIFSYYFNAMQKSSSNYAIFSVMVLNINKLFLYCLFSVCVSIEARLKFVKVESINLGCYTLPPNSTLNGTEVTEGSRSQQGQVLKDSINVDIIRQQDLKKLLLNKMMSVKINGVY